MKKADSLVPRVEYSGTVLIDLQIPQLFIQWIMQCVTTVTYSLTINGKATTPFHAKKRSEAR